VLAYGEWTRGLGQKEKGIVRAQIRLQLAEVFGEVVAVQDISWNSVGKKSAPMRIALARYHDNVWRHSTPINRWPGALVR